MATQTQTPMSNALRWFITIVAIILIGAAEYAVLFHFTAKKYIEAEVDHKMKDVEIILNDKVDFRVEQYLNDSINWKLDTLLKISNKLLIIEN